MLPKRYLLRSLLFTAILLLAASCCNHQTQTGKPGNEFSFVFMTDIHVQPEKNAEAGFRKAIQKVNELNPDFVITGGDQVMDVLGVSHGRADTLYNIYTEMAKELNMPVYNTLGNHEVFGWYERSGVRPTHREYGKRMFQKRIGPRYQRIDRHGWIFFILDSVEKDGQGGYQGRIDEEQMAWLQDQLADIDPSTPITISTHIPLLTAGAMIYYGTTAAAPSSWVVTNAKEVTELFKDHNLRLVLQGHLHIYETIHILGIQYITAGAVSGSWWTGPYYGTEEGFLLVKVNGDDFTWEYVDYGWDAF